MNIAMSSYSALGAWWVLRLMAEGHKVDYFLSRPEYADVLGGLIPAPKMLSLDFRHSYQSESFPSYKRYDLSLFDVTGKPKQAEASREDCPTLGDGDFEERLEDDRKFGLEVMEGCEIPVPPYQEFQTASEGKAFVKKTGLRYVYKPYEGAGGSEDKSITYVAKDAEDLISVIDTLWAASHNRPFILQEFVTGTELGVEAFFNGEDFYMITGTIEEKKFMNDNKGPNTGCSGNLIFAMRGDEKIYKAGLEKAKPFLRATGFRGIIDLNTIITKDKIYGLEWTPRFGYLCCPTIATMYGDGYGELLHDITTGKTPNIKWTHSFGASTTITIPPYPTEIRIPKAKGIPIEGIDPEDIESLKEFYLYDAMIAGKGLETSGNFGYVGAPLAGASSIEGAFAKVDQKIEKIQIPNAQYRTDMCKTTKKRYDTLLSQGWLS
jgi:phosphoribosylamine-glycine ligase